MRVLFFVDTHGDPKIMSRLRDRSKDADLLVCAGDFTIFENDMDHILHEFNSFGKPILIINGNHETASAVMRSCENLNNLHFIHKNYYITGDLAFFGFGGGGFATRDESFTHESEKFIRELESISSKNNTRYRIVLVTHGPPHGTKVDDIGEHVGNKSITEFIKKHHPIIAVSGHLHELAQVEDRMNSTRILNPGHDGMIIDL